MTKKRKVPRRLTTEMRGKLIIVFLVIIFLFLLLVGHLIYCTVKKGDQYKTIVLGQQNHASSIIAYERGKIFDRNGNILATNEKIYTLILEPKNILDKNKNKNNNSNKKKNSKISEPGNKKNKNGKKGEKGERGIFGKLFGK